jgi:hypothetical protein
MIDYTKKRFTKEEEIELQNVLEEESSFFDFDFKKRKFYQKFFSMLRWRTRGFYDEIKYSVQRLFRPHHLSNIDLWGFQYTMAKWIYPRLKKFISMERHGYPGIFSEYCENEWANREGYDKAIADGIHLGGGSEAWEQTLNEIIFAFEWMLHFDEYKDRTQQDKFCKKWNIKNPYEKNLENKTIHYVYEMQDGTCIAHEPDLDEKEPEKYRYKRRTVGYHNVNAVIEIQERAQKGFELFGKYFMSFWD